VLEAYAATVPGYFLYFPSRAQSSPALRLFVDAARELAVSPKVVSGPLPIVRDRKCANSTL